jgi:flagellar protein FlgJ
MQIEGFNPEPLRQAAGNTPGRAKEEGKLKDACQQFEQMYLQQMLGEMRKCSGKEKGAGGGAGGGGQQDDMFQGMLDQERAKAWSQEGGVGLANMLFQQMKQTL